MTDSKGPEASQTQAQKWRPEQLPDRVALAQSASPQDQSDLFSRLPSEIRQMIYIEMWRTAGSLSQHVMRKRHSTELTHVACTTDPGAEDVRYIMFQCSSGLKRQPWEARCKSEWCLHWACEEASEEQPQLWSPFLPVLLASKRMYLEAHPTIFSTVRFVFTDTNVAAGFLSAPAYGPATFRSLELCIRTTNTLVELYYPNAGMEGTVVTGWPMPVTAKNNPWERLCTALAALQDLRELRLWFDCKDLRPWHRRFNETRFFHRLKEIRANEFTLGLPELPDVRGQEDAAFLEGDQLAGMPFQVERGPRPNNWQVHLATMDERLRLRRAPVELP
ncbi:hypothetical protein GQ53DRAFT_670239 [Thozetella sp. PMI_491]|nr:hypothetical protein GQ53DRAFT_670239 [Thozetella sp. PMI_491]